MEVETLRKSNAPGCTQTTHPGGLNTKGTMMDPLSLAAIGGGIMIAYRELFPSPEEKAKRETQERQKAEQKRLNQEAKQTARAKANDEKERTRRRQNRHQIVAELQAELDSRLAACRLIQDTDLRISMEALAKREHATQVAQVIKE
jgi:hypothetical protein